MNMIGELSRNLGYYWLPRSIVAAEQRVPISDLIPPLSKDARDTMMTIVLAGLLTFAINSYVDLPHPDRSYYLLWIILRGLMTVFLDKTNRIYPYDE